jgi:1-acyl-sn-glycerol-3-phosphate acyltransferase
LEARDTEAIESLMPYWEWFYHYYFRVKTDGWENVPEEQVLFVGSHNGGLAAPDMIMMMYDWFRRFGTEKLIYGLMHSHVWQLNQELAKLAAKTGAIVAHPKMAIAALSKGASVLVYPGGAQDVFRPHYQRNQINFAGRRGFIKLALRQGVPIVPAISMGAHDSLIVITDCYDMAKQLHQWGMPWILGLDPQVFPIYLGLPWGIAFGPLPNLPLPVQIQTRVCKPIVFEKYGLKAASDRNYVEDCYQQVHSIMQQELDILAEEYQGNIVSSQ